MNEKASVSKELNAKHAKGDDLNLLFICNNNFIPPSLLQILEGLLKLPENRECADCRSKAPRWASINLGIFICLQCSGIHRSLGVHISKVRSTTLDTWLPEQVSFMQSMGNQKANSYWEAELPLNVDRSNIEKFIRAKYQEKKWTSPKATQPIHAIGEKSSTIDKSVAGSRSGIPRKARKYSLEEEMFSKHMSQVRLATRPRTGSLDSTDTTTDGHVDDHNACVNSVDTKQDLFSLLYVSDVKQNRAVVPPSRWATFECKITISVDIILNFVEEFHSYAVSSS